MKKAKHLLYTEIGHITLKRNNIHSKKLLLRIIFFIGLARQIQKQKFREQIKQKVVHT